MHKARAPFAWKWDDANERNFVKWHYIVMILQRKCTLYACQSPSFSSLCNVECNTLSRTRLFYYYCTKLFSVARYVRCTPVEILCLRCRTSVRDLSDKKCLLAVQHETEEEKEQRFVRFTANEGPFNGERLHTVSTCFVRSACIAEELRSGSPRRVR